jgi:SAM-dependent methyltransferase
MGDSFETENVFNDDYLYFYEPLLTAERTAAEVALIWRLLELEPGMEVLDLPCGHGRIANRLAERGARVTGVDITPRFLEVARRDAVVRGVEVSYVHGDMRALDWSARFDRVVNWFTSFGYFPDEQNRQVLASARRALRAGGRLLVEMPNLPWMLRHFLPESRVDRDGNWMINRRTYDAITGRMVETRTIIRAGKARTARFFVRLLGFPELRDWMLAAGFAHVDGYGENGQPLTAESRRMLVLAIR